MTLAQWLDQARFHPEAVLEHVDTPPRLLLMLAPDYAELVAKHPVWRLQLVLDSTWLTPVLEEAQITRPEWRRSLHGLTRLLQEDAEVASSLTSVLVGMGDPVAWMVALTSPHLSPKQAGMIWERVPKQKMFMHLTSGFFDWGSRIPVRNVLDPSSSSGERDLDLARVVPWFFHYGFGSEALREAWVDRLPSLLPFMRAPMFPPLRMSADQMRRLRDVLRPRFVGAVEDEARWALKLVEAIANVPHAPADVLEEFASWFVSPSSSLQRMPSFEDAVAAVARHENLPPENLEALGGVSPTKALLASPNLSLERALAVLGPEERVNVAYRAAIAVGSGALADHVVTSGWFDPDTVVAALLNPRRSAPVSLEGLRGDVRRVLAASTRLPASWSQEILEEGGMELLPSLAIGSTHAFVQEALAGHSDERVRLMLAHNERLGLSVASRFVRDRREAADVRTAALNHLCTRLLPNPVSKRV